MSSRQKILVIDDEFDNALIIKIGLERKEDILMLMYY